MATADEYAQWIVENEDKKGTPDFETVTQAYQQAKSEETILPKTESQPTPQIAGAGIVSPAITGYGYGAQTGLSELGGKVAGAAEPLVEAGKTALQGYAKSPGKAIVDVGAAHLGLPPPYATAESAKGLYNTYKGAIETSKNLSEAFSKLPAGTDELAKPFIESLKPADVTKLTQLTEKVGLEKALNTFQPSGKLTEEALQSLNSVKGAFPSTLNKIGQVVGPLARGAARVAGPVGMGMNMYEAYPYLEKANVGGNMPQTQQNIQQAYRNVGQNYQGPQLNPQEAQNVLSSGNKRDIKYFGGEDYLTNAIRKKAFEKVMGPVAPQ